MTEEFDEDGLGPFRGLITAAVPCAVFWIAVLAVVFSLSGCGGGDIDEPVPTPGVDCTTKPEICT